VIEGFRERVLSARPSVSPRPDWTDVQLAASARKKERRFERLRASFTRWIPTLAGARVLDVGCGDGANCALLGATGVHLAVGIDLNLPRLAPVAERERAEALLEGVVDAAMERAGPATAVLPGSRACFVAMDATRLGFAPASFDVVMSRSAAEHIQPIERALGEIVRAARPCGLIYLAIDPFFWLRGCHKRGVVDIPFAHARLPLEEYRRFVAEREGEAVAARRVWRLSTLNRFTVRRWRETLESVSCEILDWQNDHSELGAAVLAEDPGILETLLPGVAKADLLTERIEVWLRRR
jgi:SAM-dependent methyltransferase